MGGGEIQNQEKKLRLGFPVGLTMTKLRRLNRQSLINLDLISQTCRTISRTCRLSAALFWFAFLFSVLCASTADAASKTIVGYVNGTIILPCQTNRTDNLLTVEWSKDRGSIITLLFRHGHETIEEKDKAFLNRTSISVDGVKQGDISQTITELRLSDGGQYECRTRLGSQLQIEATLNLIVGAVSVPQLLFVPLGLTVECRAEGWFPEPNITFLDASGNEMKAEPAHGALQPTGYFTVTRRLSLQTDTDRVNCSVYQPLLNQRRNAYVPGFCMKYCYKEILITGVITGAAFVLVYILWKKQRLLFPFFTCRTQKPSHPTQQANPTAAPRDQAEPAGNTYLSKQIEELKSNIFERDKLIAKLEADLKELQSKCNTAQQQDRPETDQSSSHQQINQQGNTPPTASLTSLSGKSDQTSKGKGSKPGFSVQHLPTAPLKSGTQKSLPALATNESNIFRSGSFSGIRPTSVRAPRRYTMPNNPFSVLADLAEESESLISEKTKQNH